MPMQTFVWGIESWEMGVNEFTIRIDCAKVRIHRIYGFVSAAPQPNHQPYSQLIRQSLITLINAGAAAEKSAVRITGTPASRANHSISDHLFSLNLKQLNSQSLIVPIDYDFSAAPVALFGQHLIMHVFNESYKMENSAALASRDQVDGLNVEMHLRVTFDGDPL